MFLWTLRCNLIFGVRTSLAVLKNARNLLLDCNIFAYQNQHIFIFGAQTIFQWGAYVFPFAVHPDEFRLRMPSLIRSTAPHNVYMGPPPLPDHAQLCCTILEVVPLAHQWSRRCGTTLEVVPSVCRWSKSYGTTQILQCCLIRTAHNLNKYISRIEFEFRFSPHVVFFLLSHASRN